MAKKKVNNQLDIFSQDGLDNPLKGNNGVDSSFSTEKKAVIKPISKNIQQPESKGLENPFFSDNGVDASFVSTKTGDKTAGQELFDKAVTDASSPTEAKEVVGVSRMLNQNVKLNKRISDAVDSEAPEIGKALNEMVPFDKYGERTVELTTNEIKNNLYGLSPEDKERMLRERDVWSQKRKANPIEPAMEQLGVTDYYPDISRGIAVGNISSSMLGSRTRYVAQGGIMPWGVVDARKRALEKQAKEQAAKIDEIKNKKFVTSAQFQQQYDGYFMDKQAEFLDLAGDDLEILTDPSTELGREYMKFMTKMENAYKENLYVDGVADGVLSKHGEGEYVPDYMLDLIDQWNSGKMNMEEYVLGEKGVSGMAPMFKSYENAITWGEDYVELIQGNPNVKPINPKVDLTNPTLAKNAQDALKFKSGMSYDEYITGVSKYWDISEIAKAVDSAFTQKRFYKGTSDEEEAILKANLVDFISNSLQDEVELEVETVANKKLDYARLALDRDKFNHEKEMDISFNQMIHDVNVDLGNKIQEIQSDPTLSKEQKNRAIQQLTANQVNYNPEFSKRFGFNVGEVHVSSREQEMTHTYKIGEVNIGNAGETNATYKLSDIPEMLKKHPEGSPEHEYYKSFEGTFNYAQSQGGYITMPNEKRFAAPAVTWIDNDGVSRYAPAQKISGKKDSKIQTLNIDLSSTYIAGYDEKGNAIYEPIGAGGGWAYSTLDKINIAERDARDKQASIEAERGESHRKGGVTTGTSSSTTRIRE